MGFTMILCQAFVAARVNPTSIPPVRIGLKMEPSCEPNRTGPVVLFFLRFETGRYRNKHWDFRTNKFEVFMTKIQVNLGLIFFFLEWAAVSAGYLRLAMYCNRNLRNSSISLSLSTLLYSRIDRDTPINQTDWKIHGSSSWRILNPVIWLTWFVWLAIFHLECDVLWC